LGFPRFIFRAGFGGDRGLRVVAVFAAWGGRGFAFLCRNGGGVRAVLWEWGLAQVLFRSCALESCSWFLEVLFVAFGLGVFVHPPFASLGGGRSGAGFDWCGWPLVCIIWSGCLHFGKPWLLLFPPGGLWLWKLRRSLSVGWTVSPCERVQFCADRGLFFGGWRFEAGGSGSPLLAFLRLLWGWFWLSGVLLGCAVGYIQTGLSVLNFRDL